MYKANKRRRSRKWSRVSMDAATLTRSAELNAETSESVQLVYACNGVKLARPDEVSTNFCWNKSERFNAG